MHVTRHTPIDNPVRDGGGGVIVVLLWARTVGAGSPTSLGGRRRVTRRGEKKKQIFCVSRKIRTLRCRGSPRRWWCQWRRRRWWWCWWLTTDRDVFFFFSPIKFRIRILFVNFLISISTFFFIYETYGKSTGFYRIEYIDLSTLNDIFIFYSMILVSYS